MRKTEKTIERCNRIIDKAAEDLKQEYQEALGNYNETGFNRYYNKMQKLEEDLDKLDDYRHAKRYLAELQRKADKLEKVMALYLKKLDELKAEYPGDDYVSQIVGRCKSKLESAKMEVDTRR